MHFTVSLSELRAEMLWMILTTASGSEFKPDMSNLIMSDRLTDTVTRGVTYSELRLPSIIVYPVSLDSEFWKNTRTQSVPK